MTAHPEAIPPGSRGSLPIMLLIGQSLPTSESGPRSKRALIAINNGPSARTQKMKPRHTVAHIEQGALPVVIAAFKG